MPDKDAASDAEEPETKEPNEGWITSPFTWLDHPPIRSFLSLAHYMDWRYACKKGNEKPSEVAKQHQVPLQDLMFLNKKMYPELVPGSRLRAGTQLQVPTIQKPGLPKTRM